LLLVGARVRDSQRESPLAVNPHGCCGKLCS
jgi:hypothetical protein